jgi:hypothetical protein
MDPLDASLPNFKKAGKERKCSEVLDEIKTRFESGMYGCGDDYANDLPIHMVNCLEDTLINKLSDCESFTNKRELREEVKTLFDHILKPWKGQVTQLVKQKVKAKIDFAEACERDKVFSFFYNDIRDVYKE